MKNSISRVRGWLISLALALATFIGFARVTNWKFSLFLMGSVLFHELGHAWAMKRHGLRIETMIFIPFMGMVIIPEEWVSSRKAEAIIAVMGPLWGGLQAAVMLFISAALPSPLLASLTTIVIFINLFNLVPINPLDGGRVVKSILHSFSPRVSVAFLALGLLATIGIGYFLNPFVAALVMYLGVPELVAELREVRAWRDRKLIIESLAKLLDTKPQDVAVRKKIAALRRETFSTDHCPEVLIRVLGCGDTTLEKHLGTLPARNPMIRMVFWDTFKERLVACALAARKEHHTLFRRTPYFVTPPFGKTIQSLEELDRLVLRNKSMQPMTGRQAAYASVGYLALCAALAAMFVISILLGNQDALRSFMH